jgi:hypothetical protein
MATPGFIYDTVGGGCLACLTDDGAVVDVTPEGRQVGTYDRKGNVYSLQGELLGHLSTAGNFDGGTPAAFRKLFGR